MRIRLVDTYESGDGAAYEIEHRDGRKENLFYKNVIDLIKKTDEEIILEPSKGFQQHSELIRLINEKCTTKK